MNKSQIDTKEGKEWLRSLLRSEIVTITFNKKDGSERIMKCTLSESEIPTENLPKTSKQTHSDESIAVFDIEKTAWRSFRFDSVKKIEFTLGEN
ncbi:MAG: SH3 beta-barrel fold-containing protein [Chitinophagaceae bacterium]